mmetsp:Transcript_25879/g.49041  ORF Transcript_25879/g.49041 Transcript_25879/m.49041 type:complete len:91 (-) Transcript_25879:212-484(-)
MPRSCFFLVPCVWLVASTVALQPTTSGLPTLDMVPSLWESSPERAKLRARTGNKSIENVLEEVPILPAQSEKKGKPTRRRLLRSTTTKSK